MSPLLTLLFTSLAQAAPSASAPNLKAPDFSLSAASRDSGLSVTATAPAGYHFNTDAPMSAELDPSESKKRVKPASATPASVVFALEASAKDHPVTYTLYLCDDQKTFCEAHHVRAQVNAENGALNLLNAAETQPEGALDSAGAPVKGLEHGFIVNDPKTAVAQAKAGKKPLLIDFFGIWCPPCNELDEEVFPSAEFAKASKGFVKLKLDADAPVSWELKSRFRIGGYPTVVFASVASNGDLDEIGRVVGFRTAGVFSRETGRAYRDRTLPLNLLRSRADRGDIQAAGKLGMIYNEREEYGLAKKYLEKAVSTSAKHATGKARTGAERELLAAREGLATAEIGEYEQAQKTKPDASTEALLVARLESAVKEFPDSPDSIERRSRLAELYDSRKQADRKTAILKEQVRVATALTAHPERFEDFDLTVADLWATIADAEEGLGHADASREAWKKAAAEYRARIAKLGPGATDRGYAIELAYSLWKSGDSDAAEALYTKYEGLYPKEFTYYFGHARMKYALKKYDNAKRLAEKAFEFGYGDNRLRAAELLAKTLKAQDQEKEAIAVIQTALTSTPLPADGTIRTHRYVKNLQELLK